MTVIDITGNSSKESTGFVITLMCKIDRTDHNSLGTLTAIVVDCVNSEYSPNDSNEYLLEWIKENIDLEYYVVIKIMKLCSSLTSYRHAIND
ncbi:unnamed protein product [Rotaria sp. Silwood2]|nr:unnamed protein product [Rotaria sp. Silwood2]CAF4384515.1 unnamed protein product [Rotaria sp. Silwood2]